MSLLSWATRRPVSVYSHTATAAQKCRNEVGPLFVGAAVAVCFFIEGVVDHELAPTAALLQ